MGKQGESSKEADDVPIPIVIIDQGSAVVEITFGDRLGALLETVTLLGQILVEFSISLNNKLLI